MSTVTSSSHTPRNTPPQPTRRSTKRRRVGAGVLLKARSDERKKGWKDDKRVRAYSPKAVKMLGLSLKPPVVVSPKPASAKTPETPKKGRAK